MQLEGQYTFEVPREVLWDALLDPAVIAKTLPGCDELTAVGENDYKATLNVKVGPVQGRFEGQFSLTDLQPPDRYHLKMSGKGPSGFLQGEGDIRLEAQGDSTLLYYRLEAQVGGPVAAVGQRLLDSSARSISRQGLEQLERQVKSRSEAAAEVEGAPEAEPSSSQQKFATTVARDVMADLLPRERRIMLVTVSAAVVAVLLIIIFRACG